MRFRTFAVMLAAIVLVGPACGDDDATAEDDGTRTIELTDFQFSPDLAAVSAGQTVEFIVTNHGAVEHEFRVTTQRGIDDHIAGGHQEHLGDDDMHDDDMGDMGDDMGDMDDDDMGGDDIGGDDIGEMPKLVIPPGETMTLTVTMPDDPTTYTRFVCLIPGHYEAGMVGEIVYSG
ncbi:MAG: plastocyanin/azurin family copper-binding protein [Actinomycetota bacterium]|nr:plastocyanin/azurin family copper-binding protein [Actinomycetota bacterium]